MQVTPAILPQNFEEIQDKLSALEGLASCVQIDLCDGEFGLVKTWLPSGTEQLPDEFIYEFDLMVNDWQEYTKKAIDIGATRIVLHTDSFSEAECHEALAILEGTGVHVGISVSNDSSLEQHVQYVSFFKDNYEDVFIQVMGIRNIGAQGQEFDEEVVSRIEELSLVFPGTSIQVDGSMNNLTAEKVKDAGADTIVSGSYIFSGEDVSERLLALESI